MKLKPLKQFICHSCGKLIDKPEDGWWEYLDDGKTNLVSGFRIVHYGGPCYYNVQALRRKNITVGDMHLNHMLTSGAFGHMLHWLELSKTKQIDSPPLAEKYCYLLTIQRLSSLAALTMAKQ